jgi:hypothetical protein
MVFIHGGAWIRSTKVDASFPAPIFDGRGAIYIAGLLHIMLRRARPPPVRGTSRSFRLNGGLLSDRIDRGIQALATRILRRGRCKNAFCFFGRAGGQLCYLGMDLNRKPSAGSYMAAIFDRLAPGRSGGLAYSLEEIIALVRSWLSIQKWDALDELVDRVI